MLRQARNESIEQPTYLDIRKSANIGNPRLLIETSSANAKQALHIPSIVPEALDDERINPLVGSQAYQGGGELRGQSEFVQSPGQKSRALNAQNTGQEGLIPTNNKFMDPKTGMVYEQMVQGRVPVGETYTEY